MTLLLSFFKYYFKVLGNIFCDLRLHQFALEIPSKSNAAYRLLKIPDNSFVKYVVCTSCNSIYELEKCLSTNSGTIEAKKCWYTAYPNHPHPARRKPCGSQLLRRVRSGSKYRFVPNKVYPYQPLHQSLGYLVKRKDFLLSSELWSERSSIIPDGDVYDGWIWHDFSSDSLGNFLSSPFSYLLTLNVDWFQPFTHTEY